jgi:hypothetical protein
MPRAARLLSTLKEERMASHLPPVPPEQQSPKGPQDQVAGNAGEAAGQADERDRNLDQQGRQGNSKQNTTNKGYQQDR